ncbi:MAG TPA: 50S ribosomal protein L23 [bacterium]|nr:50S ribosomal protein L23 [bacterium]HPT29936.1 50S ribosomal protein L23 [bacterium]
MAIFNKKTKEDDKQPAAKEAVKAEKKDSSMKDLYAGEKAAKSAVSKKKIGTRADRILLKPVVTEKATNLSAHNQYVFMVARGANKIEVAKAITAVYGVKPLSVNIVNIKGKKVYRGRTVGVRSNIRKAIVTLAKNDSIQIYEGV